MKNHPDMQKWKQYTDSIFHSAHKQKIFRKYQIEKIFCDDCGCLMHRGRKYVKNTRYKQSFMRILTISYWHYWIVFSMFCRGVSAGRLWQVQVSELWSCSCGWCGRHTGVSQPGWVHDNHGFRSWWPGRSVILFFNVKELLFTNFNHLSIV